MPIHYPLMNIEAYSAYLRAFAKSASGAKITEADFLEGALPEVMDLPGQAAVALAVQDVDVAPVSTGHLLKGKSDVRNDEYPFTSAKAEASLHA